MKRDVCAGTNMVGRIYSKSFFIILRIFLLLIVIFLIIEFISKLKDKKARVNSDKFVPENPEVYGNALNAATTIQIQLLHATNADIGFDSMF